MNPSWMLENRSGEDRSTETLLNREETFLFQRKPQYKLKNWEKESSKYLLRYIKVCIRLHTQLLQTVYKNLRWTHGDPHHFHKAVKFSLISYYEWKRPLYLETKKWWKKRYAHWRKNKQTEESSVFIVCVLSPLCQLWFQINSIRWNWSILSTKVDLCQHLRIEKHPSQQSLAEASRKGKYNMVSCSSLYFILDHPFLSLYNHARFFYGCNLQVGSTGNFLFVNVYKKKKKKTKTSSV